MFARKLEHTLALSAAGVPGVARLPRSRKLPLVSATLGERPRPAPSSRSSLTYMLRPSSTCRCEPLS